MLEQVSNSAVDAIDSIVDRYIGHALLDIREPLQVQFELLDSRQATRVLNLRCTPWAVRLLKEGLTSGFGDFLDRVLALRAEGKFTGNLAEVFGDVVPLLLDMQCRNSDSVALFVFRIGQSDQFSPLEKEQIIWGTQGAADPTTVHGGHWARANEAGNDAIQSGLLEGVNWLKRQTPSAAPEPPPQEPAPCCTLL